MAGTLSQDGVFSTAAWPERRQPYLQKTGQQLDQVEFDRGVEAPIALLDVLTVAVTGRLGQRGTDSLERLHQLKTSYFPLG